MPRKSTAETSATRPPSFCRFVLAWPGAMWSAARNTLRLNISRAEAGDGMMC